MLTHIAHLITLPRFASARRPSQFKIKYVASPASVVFTQVIAQEKKPFVIVAPFLLPSPFFMLLHPDWLASTSWFVWSLGQLRIFTRLCCFRPWLCPKKKASVIVAQFLLIFSLFFYWFTQIGWYQPFEVVFISTWTAYSLVPLGWSCATFAHISLTEHKWKTCSSNLWVFLRQPVNFILFYFVVLELRGYFS